MHSFRSSIPAGLLLSLGLVASPAALCADIIVSAQDGKFVRVDGRATFPEPAPSDSLVVIDASTFPPVIKGTVEGLEHTVQGPPQAVAVTPDGKLAIVAQRDENGAAVLSIEGMSVKLTAEKISTGVTPYAVDISSDGKWAIIGNTGVTGMLGLVGRTVGDADVVTLVDVSKRPFRAVQQLSMPSTPEGVAISPDGRWIAVSCMAGSNLTTDNAGRNKIGRLLRFEIKDGWATKVNELAGAEAAQGVVFSQDSKQILLQMDVEQAIGVFALRDGKLVDTGERLKLAAGPVSIRSMPR